MKLPRKDKDGNSYLSYSQIDLFKKDRNEYYKRYILGEKFEGNAYTDFGSKVGKALETNDFSEFSEDEVKILEKVTRLDHFEREVKLHYDGFYVLGYIDTMSEDFKYIIDYKTGGYTKHDIYLRYGYDQLAIYALALRQETGVTPEQAQVEFITRESGKDGFKVADASPLHISIDISMKRLKAVYWDVLKVAKEIETYYKNLN